MNCPRSETVSQYAPVADENATLVLLSGEPFPRLRTMGRLIWLGDPRPDKWDYHDPESPAEFFWHADAGRWVELSDPERFSPRLPAGVRVTEL